MTAPYEAWFGLKERPFSLTADARYFFKSRSHGRALEALPFALRRGEPFLMLSGDLGVGKTILCRTLAEHLQRRAPIAIVPSPLVTPAALFRLLLEDFAADPLVTSDGRPLGAAEPHELRAWLVQYLQALPAETDAVVIVDDAHLLPATLAEEMHGLAAHVGGERPRIQFVFAGQVPASDELGLSIPLLDARVMTRVRLLPLGRFECADYIAHRLAVAGAPGAVIFDERAVESLYAVSGGLPRLIHLLAERALQEGAARGLRTIDAPLVESVASGLELLRPRPRRFRWFSKRVS